MSRIRPPTRSAWAWTLLAYLVACGSSQTGTQPGGQPGGQPGDQPGETSGEPSAANADDDASAPSQPAELERDDEIRIAAIERAVNQTRGAQHECWAYAAAEDFRVSGSMVLRLTMTSAGGNASVEIVSDEPGSARLSACITELFQRYRWPEVFEPGQSMELPLSFRAPRGQYTVNAAYVEPIVLANGALRAAIILHERNTGNGIAALSRLLITGDIEIDMHRHDGNAEVLYVERGSLTIYDHRGARRGTVIRAGQAVYVPPGAVHGGTHRGSDTTSVIQFFTPPGPQARYLGERTPGTEFLTREQVRGVPRDAPRPIVVDKTRAYALPGGGGRVDFYIDAEVTGDNKLYMGIIRADPGYRVPLHRHPGASEYLMILEGQATMTVAGKSYPVTAETAVQIPTNLEHSVAVEGDTPLVAIQFYTPGGPEQRFKANPLQR